MPGITSLLVIVRFLLGVLLLVLLGLTLELEVAPHAGAVDIHRWVNKVNIRLRESLMVASGRLGVDKACSSLEQKIMRRVTKHRSKGTYPLTSSVAPIA